MSPLSVLALLLGILAVMLQPQLPDVATLLWLTPAAVLPWRGRSLYALALLGALLAIWQGQRLLDRQWPEARYGEEIEVAGHVASLPEASTDRARDGEVQGRVWRFLFEPDDAGLPPKMRVSWYRSLETLRGGQCWRLRLRMRPPHGSVNPGGFDYEGWLFSQGITATATVRTATRCDDDSGYRLLKLRQALVDQLRGWMPPGPARGLFIALTLGDTSDLNRDDWNLFRVTGTTHLVAISGFNIAIIAGIAFFALRWLWCLWPPLLLRWPAQKAALLGAASLAFVYALLAGWEPPVQRAFLMFGFVALAAWRGRLSRPSRVLALAGFVVLVMDPLAVLSPGLWLSFAAVGAIFYAMMNRLQAPGWLHTLVMLQLMLTLVLAPLTVWYFHGLSWFAPLLNLVAVPLCSLITPVLLLSMALAFVAPAWGVPLIQYDAQMLGWLYQGMRWLAATLPHPWMPASAPMAALGLALMGALLLFAPHGLPVRRLALLCFLPLLFPQSQAPQRGFDLTALDVGQGLSVVVRTARHTLVFDAGPAFDEGFDAGAAIVAPFLLDQGVRRIDRLVISHADNDHAGGAAALRGLIPVIDEWGALSKTPCHDGQKWIWDGVTFEMLHPDDAQWSRNNGACVLRIEAGSYAALLPADIEKQAEARLLGDHLTSLQADVLLAPHHGSRSSSTEDFVDAVQARWVIHSAAWHSQFHHPTPSVVARYARAGAQQVVTGLRGAVSLHVDESGVGAPRFAREAQRHFWNAASQDLVIDPDATDSRRR